MTEFAGLAGAASGLALAAFLSVHAMRRRAGAADRTSRSSTDPGSHPWGLDVLYALGYLPGVDLSTDDFHIRQAWDHAQVVFAEAEGDSVVLDCLIPSDEMARGDARPVRIPMTLRAHGPADGSGSLGLGKLVDWVASGEPVDILVGMAGLRPVLRIGDSHAYVTLELEQAGRS